MRRNINRDDLIRVYPGFSTLTHEQKALLELLAEAHLNRAPDKRRRRLRKAWRETADKPLRPVF